MLGYVIAEKSELKVREMERYQAYYCGICKAVSDRTGQLPRMVLQYDCVFLALVLEDLFGETEQIAPERCIAHPLAKRPVARGSRVLDYAADSMVLLAYHKFLDDWQDEHSGRALAGRTALRPAYGTVRRRQPQLCGDIADRLSELSALEAAHCDSVDRTGGCFGELLATLFTGFDRTARENRILAELGRHLGKWIYLIDALDDFAKDVERDRYNPLRYRRQQLRGVDVLLYHELAELGNALDLLALRRNRGIIENIVFLGLRGQTDRIVAERTEERIEA